VSETTGSEATALNGAASDETPKDQVFNSTGEDAGRPRDEPATPVTEVEMPVEFVDAELETEIEVEHVDIARPPPVAGGFQAFLKHASLHNLLQIESLSRTSGVFEVTSDGREGYLHLSNGELMHAEAGGLSGESAASEILSWEDGEFKSSDRPLATSPTIYSSLQVLLLRLARDADESSHAERPPAPVVALPVEEDKPTEPHLPVPSAAERGSQPTSTQLASMQPVSRQTSSSPPPRSGRLPPPLPPRIDRESASVAEVVLSAAGDILQGRGAAPEEFSARVAYAARLADLIGRAIRSGTPRAVELRGKSTQTLIKWQADGTLSAALELVQAGKR
jgi:hypothetical protein